MDVLEPIPLESPSMELRRVMISRNVGRMEGSWCQHVVMRFAKSVWSASSGISGRSESRITATATAAGLRRRVNVSVVRRVRRCRLCRVRRVPHAVVGLLACEHLPEHDAKGIHIGQDVINRVNLVENLGRRPVDASLRLLLRSAGLLQVLLELGQPKVAHLMPFI